MRKSRWALAIAPIVALCTCGRREPLVRVPEPTPRVVYVEVTPVRAPTTSADAVAAAIAALPPTPAPVAMSAEQSFPMPTPVRMAVVEEPAPEPKVESLREQMVKCLDFSVERTSAAPIMSGLARMQVKITARNRCDVGFAGSDVEVEVRVRPGRGGGIAAREHGNFQNPIPGRGSADTFLEVNADPNDDWKFEASPWYAAGGGRKAGE